MHKKQDYITPIIDIVHFEKEEIVTMNVSGLDASDYEKDNNLIFPSAWLK